MQEPLPPGPASPRRAPLPTVALIVGATLCSIAVASALLRDVADHLAHDPLVMRALGATLAMASVMLARTALTASAGMRRVAALVVAAPPIALGATLLAWPAGAALLYDRAMGTLAPWLVGVPGLLALVLSRWRVR